MKVNRVISMYDKSTESLVDETSVDEVSFSVFEEIFDPPEDDPLLYNTYEIKSDETRRLKDIVPISFERFMAIAGRLHQDGKIAAFRTAMFGTGVRGGIFNGEHAYAGRMIMQGWFSNRNDVSSLGVYSKFRQLKKAGKLEGKLGN